MIRRFGHWTVAVLLWATSVEGAETSLNLEAALRLAGAKNLAIQMARERIAEAQGRLQQQKDRFLPWVTPGMGYRRHDGNLQDVVGEVFDVSKQSGTAALVLQAQVDLGQAYYEVLAAKQTVAANEAEAEASRRETLLSVALGYTELCRAVASVQAANEAVEISRRTARQVEEAVVSGLAFAGDAQRSKVQWGRTEADLLEARLAEKLASTRLAQLLRLPPDQLLQPDLNEFVPVEVVATHQPLGSLVALALTNRPERRRTEAVILGMRAQRDAVVKGPWWPTAGAQAGLGLLVGGPNDQFGNAGDFGEYSAGLSWRIGPGGIGDRARRRTASARLRLAELESEELKDRVTREVVECRSRAEFAVEQVTIAVRNVAAARRLQELTQGRREFGIGAILEAVDAERELARAQTEHLRAIANHNECQWEFWYVIGQEDTGSRSIATP